MSNLELYVFRPNGHGLPTYFTLASDEREAQEAVIKYIKKCIGEEFYYGLEEDDLGNFSNYYGLEIYGQGEVGENDND